MPPLNEALPDDTAAPAVEPDLRDTIREAVARQREPDAEAAPEPDAASEAQEEKPAAAERKDGRDEQGRFAPKADEPPKPAQAEGEKPPAVAAEEKPADPAVQAIRPPPGWSPASKADFEKLPAHIKADVAKREQEVNQGFAKLAEYRDLEPLAELAKQNGTTLPAAVQNYRQFEVQLQRDFLGGIEMVCQRFGVNPAALAQAIMSRGQQPAGQQQRQAQQIDPQAIIEQARAAARAEMEQAQVSQSIEAFKADPANIYFENVKPQMSKLLQAGLATSLKDAYDQACAIAPDVAAAIKQRAAPTEDPAAKARAIADQARRAARATLGAPATGISPGASQDPNASLRDTIRAARDAQVGRA